MDAQAGIDAAESIYSIALAGGHLCHDMGLIDSGLTASLEYLVVCEQTVERIRRLMTGMIINEETVPLDLIDEVGPSGSYLSTKHTYRHFKDELTMSDMYENGLYEHWVEGGRKSMEDRANEKVRRILAEHVPKPLPEATLVEIDRILKEATQEK